MFCVYIIRSRKNNSMYIGYTTDIKKRIEYHNCGFQKSTKKFIPYNLMWFCVFPNKTLALKFEKYLKSSSGHAFLNKRFILKKKDTSH